MKQPKKLSRGQKKFVSDIGLNYKQWMCNFEDNRYLHIISKDVDKRSIRIIDKAKKVLASSKANQD